MPDLFSDEAAEEPNGVIGGTEAYEPLAHRLRPKTLDDVVGQPHLLDEGGTLRRMISSGSLSSLIFWGPPGTGKTTVARLLAGETGVAFEQISAIFSGVADLKKVFEAARLRRTNGRTTLLFVDEIHRFNKAQQDSFLPVMEDGTIVLVGATTENPSFELNSALLSRARVLTFRPHGSDSLESLLSRAEKLVGTEVPVTEEGRQLLISFADGDGRALLSMAEEIWRAVPNDRRLSEAELKELLQRRAPIYDKSDDGHYNLISALHKSVRGSDPDAALYYLCRMLDAGEDPRYIARRLMRMACEDIGNADPKALEITLSASKVYRELGSPEGELALAQACVYVATAPKSNAVYTAYKAAMRSAREHGSLPPPRHILNAPTKLMKAEGYGEGYRYDHDEPDAFSGQDYFPETMDREEFYNPVDRGFEREIAKRLAFWRKRRAGTDR